MTIDSPTANRLKVLTFIPRYLPGYKAGGQLRTVARLAEVLSDDIEFKIVTSDRDAGDRESYTNIKLDVWNTVGDVQVNYRAPHSRGFGAWRDLISNTPHDVIFLNSFFHFHFSIKLILLRFFNVIDSPIVLAPQGEFSPGALALKSAKKRLFISLARFFGLYNHVLWKATSELEAEHIRREFGHSARVHVAMDMPTIDNLDQELPPRPRKQPGAVRLVYLSRISPKKNLDGALRILETLSGEITYDIIGPISDPAYWRKCERIAASLPKNITVNYLGPIKHDEVVKTLAGYDLFFFPTHGENFGHAVPEALIAGCPVLISDQTPWRGLAERGVGWDIALSDADKFRATLTWAIEATHEEWSQWSARARAFGLTTAYVEESIEAHKKLFRDALQAYSLRR